MWLIWLIYIADIIENVQKGFIIFGVISLIIALILIIGTFMTTDKKPTKPKATNEFALKEYTHQLEEYKEHLNEQSKTLKLGKRFLWVAIPLLVLAHFIPSQRAIYTMAAAYVGVSVVQSDRVQKIGNDVLTVLEKKLQQMKQE